VKEFHLKTSSGKVKKKEKHMTRIIWAADVPLSKTQGRSGVGRLTFMKTGNGVNDQSY